MKKKLIATGPNGTFRGLVIVSSRFITKRSQGDISRKMVYDVEAFVNDHLFGEVSRNLPDAATTEVEVTRHIGLVQAHLNKLANTEAGASLKTRLSAIGFENGGKNKIGDLNEWIKNHTRPVGIEPIKKVVPRAAYVIRRKTTTA